MTVSAGHVQTLTDALAYWAATTPHSIALLTPEGESVSYQALHEAVARLAAEFRQRGLRGTDGIALLVPEGPDLCLALLAAMSAGVAVPLAYPAPATEYQWILSSPRLRAVVISAEVALSAVKSPNAALSIMALHPRGSGRVENVSIKGPVLGEPIPLRTPNADDVTLILHSSGTTGQPKIIPRTHRNIVSTGVINLEAKALTPADRCLNLGKTVHSRGITTLATSLLTGATFVSPPELDLGALPRWLHESNPTYLSASPAILRLLAADDGPLQEAVRHAPIRSIHATSGPLAPEEQAELERVLGAPILNNYGATEATCIAGERYARDRRVPGSVGLPWCDVQIVDAGGRPVARGEIGEIVVRGSRVFPGYLDDAEANAAAFFSDGWFRTGDLGTQGAEGYLFISGRIGEMINRGGEKIAPAEVDQVLVSHPAVADGATFAVPDALLGEDIVAAVVLEPGARLSSRALRAWMLDRLIAHKVPRRIWVVDNLPRTLTGKVRRGVLAERWGATRG